MAAFDYGSPAELFSSKSDAGLFPSKSDVGLSPAGRQQHRRQPSGYGRFAHAAYAIRFAIEELPSGFLPDTCLEVNAELFDRDEIRRLYDSEDYPLARRAMARWAY